MKKRIEIHYNDETRGFRLVLVNFSLVASDVLGLLVLAAFVLMGQPRAVERIWEEPAPGPPPGDEPTPTPAPGENKPREL